MSQSRFRDLLKNRDAESCRTTSRTIEVQKLMDPLHRTWRREAIRAEVQTIDPPPLVDLPSIFALLLRLHPLLLLLLLFLSLSLLLPLPLFSTRTSRSEFVDRFAPIYVQRTLTPTRDVEDREIRASSNSRCDYRKSARNACNAEMSFRSYAPGASRTSVVNDQPCTRVICTQLYAHARKSIHQMVAYLEQLALYNYHEYIISQTYLVVCVCDVIANIISLFSCHVSELPPVLSRSQSGKNPRSLTSFTSRRKTLDNADATKRKSF